MNAVVLFCAIVNVAVGYPNGPPPQACDSGMPGHGHEEQKSAAPFRIFVPNRNFITPNGQVRVILTRAPGSQDEFEGFLVQALDPEGNRIGKFQAGEPTEDVKFVDCGGVEASAAGHSSKKHKTRIGLIWTPDGYEGKAYFTATFLKEFDEFWRNVTSPLLTVVVPKVEDIPPEKLVVQKQEEKEEKAEEAETGEQNEVRNRESVDEISVLHSDEVEDEDNNLSDHMMVENGADLKDLAPLLSLLRLKFPQLNANTPLVLITPDDYSIQYLGSPSELNRPPYLRNRPSLNEYNFYPSSPFTNNQAFNPYYNLYNSNPRPTRQRESILSRPARPDIRPFNAINNNAVFSRPSLSNNPFTRPTANFFQPLRGGGQQQSILSPQGSFFDRNQETAPNNPFSRPAFPVIQQRQPLISEPSSIFSNPTAQQPNNNPFSRPSSLFDRRPLRERFTSRRMEDSDNFFIDDLFFFK